MDSLGLLAGLAALVELPALAAPVSIRTAFSFLLRALGVAKDTPRADLPHVVPAAAAVSVLNLLSANLPEDVSLHDAAAALCADAAAAYSADLGVQLDALLGLSCLLSSGSTQDKLQLCFWTLDRDSSGSLDLQQLLGVVPAAQRAAAAARVILQEATLQSLAEEAADPQHTAHQQQGCAVLREILTRAFAEADPQNTGLVRPGQGLMQLLFAAAAQLTSVMVGATPLLSHEATGFGSSRASSMSTTPSRSVSASPFRLPQHQQATALSMQPQQPPAFHHQQQHQNAGGQHTGGAHNTAARAGVGGGGMMTTNNTLEAMDSIGGSCALADVVIVDSEGGLLHYQAPVDQAAAAACHGRAPLAVYAPTTTNHQRPSQHNSSRGGSMQHSAAGGGLAPASSLLQHLELLEAQQQQQQHQQQQQQHTASDTDPGLFLTPSATGYGDETLSAAGTNNNGAAADSMPTSPFQDHPRQQQQQQHGSQNQQHQDSQQQQQQPQQGNSILHRMHVRPRQGTNSSSPGSSQNNSLRRIFVGSPFNTISESAGVSGGTTSSGTEAAAGGTTRKGGGGGAGGAGGGGDDAGADEGANAAPATAAGAITSTATNVMETVQSNILAVVVKLLLNCGMCFLVSLMVVLGDAAIVTGLHLGAALPLSVSFGVAVAANAVLVLALVVLLVAVRLANRANNRSLADVANSPEAQQLDQIVETMKAAVQALKNTEKQQQQAANAAGSASNRFTGSHFLASRASSMKDVEAGGRGGSGGGAGGMGGGGGGPLAVAGRLQAVWSAVGRVAGFLPPGQPSVTESDMGHPAGPLGSGVGLGLDGGTLLAVGGHLPHSSTSWGASSGAGGGAVGGSGSAAAAAAPLLHGSAAPTAVGAAVAKPNGVGVGGGGAGATAQLQTRPAEVQQQGRQQRVAGTAALPSGAAPVAMREAYPQL